MGRTKGKHLHTGAKELTKKHAHLFASDFEHNKKAVRDLGILAESKTERNKLAGEISKIMRRLLPKPAKTEETAEA